jgi:hypothetical protein
VHSDASLVSAVRLCKTFGWAHERALAVACHILLFITGIAMQQMDISFAELPKNPNRNMSGVPEWSQAEVDAVMRLYDERGRLPKWKPIADELSQMNATGELNPTLLQKGLIRSNNAVMNKVKEILYKELGDVQIKVCPD